MSTELDTATPTLNWSCPLTPALNSITQQLWSAINQVLSLRYAASLPLSETTLQELNNYLVSPTHTMPESIPALSGWILGEAFDKITFDQQLSVTALFKIFLFFKAVSHNNYLYSCLSSVLNRLYIETGQLNLLMLEQLLNSTGRPSYLLIEAYADPCVMLANDWKSEDVWPFFAKHANKLHALLAASEADMPYAANNRAALFQAVSLLPKMPANLVELLYQYAFCSLKQNRIHAQCTLNNHAEKIARIIAALGHSKAEVRTQAALWAAKLKISAALPALESVVKKEKIDACKAAQLDALQALGQSVTQYLDSAQLLKEAAKCVSKGIPKELAWFSWQALPQLHWADSQQRVECDVLRYFCIQAVKQKSPEPNALLRKYCSMFAEPDREQLGLFVLEQWIAEDTRLPTPEQALALAHQRVEAYSTSLLGFNIKVEDLLPSCSNTPFGSAISSKGLLAITAACATSGVSDRVARYLKQYYGMRAAQCRALITMLAWVEHPLAIHLLLATGNRFRTKSIQEEASAQVHALAERKGWTLDELADRTVPTAGLDDMRELQLSYGTRCFSVRLLDNFALELRNPDGKTINALPDPRQDDDEVAATRAKKQLGATKKELKAIVKQQSERFYEAMCSERTWHYHDWQLYLQQHPIMSLLVQQLLWFDIERGVCFRPLNDGSLSDVNDNGLTLPAQQHIRLVHGSLLAPTEISAWQQHLIDYQVIPLFNQIGKSYFALPDALNNANKLETFNGHLLEAFSLRNQAGKLGYIRGSTEDGGRFYCYEKNFPSLNLKCVIEFSGNQLPEENHTVALLNLSFKNQQQNIALNKVPKVLLSECYQDMRSIAEQGSGFDSDWEKKVYQ